MDQIRADCPNRSARIYPSLAGQGHTYLLQAPGRRRPDHYRIHGLLLAGSAAGTALSTYLYSLGGWGGICLTGLCFSLGALTLWSYAANASNQSGHGRILGK